MKKNQTGYMVVDANLERVGTVYKTDVDALDKAAQYAEETGEKAYVAVIVAKVQPAVSVTVLN